MEKLLENRIFNPIDYDFYVNEYVKKSKKLGKPISYSNLRKSPFNLPDARWYVKNCPEKSVTRWSEFVDWCSFVANNKKPSKEKVIKLIYKMQEEIKRPLLYDDFRGKGCYHVPIEIIREYWGTINKMKEELGLEIVQGSMIDRHLSKNEFDNMISNICEFIYNENRNFITTREINSHKEWNNYNSLRKYAKKYYNVDIAEILKNKGIKLGKQGSGINFIFEDGEHVTSQFEYMFSKFLKEYGLVYNVDYFRDVKYSIFIPQYSGRMNCDYVIHIKGKIIYIEIAGIIEPYKMWFFNNKPIIGRKSREKYRLKLKSKEILLRNNGLIYFILFPCDLTKENFISILENSSIELRKQIESFMKNNIEWDKVRKIGELKYTNQVKWGRNVIDYGDVVSQNTASFFYKTKGSEIIE